ncbi:MAG: calcium-binding protein [Rhodospirillales bacterium]|nr:calcium-binding protein [Rhodospirillales bacterium]
MTCLPHPLYADDTTADEWLAAAGGVAGFLAASEVLGPYSAPLAALAFAFGTGSAIAASWEDGDFDWSGFERSMAVLTGSTILSGTVLSPIHTFIGEATESWISIALSRFPESTAAALYSGGWAALTGAYAVNPLLDKLLDIGCGHSDPTYGDFLVDDATKIDPLVIDLNRDGHADFIPLVDSPVFFQPGSYAPTFVGMATRTGWVGPTDGLLAIDGDGNGTIDGHSELFGSELSIWVGLDYKDGFKKLASYDLNHDNVINSQDAVYDRLLVWQDLNTNGYSEPNELKSLQQAGIASINLNADANLASTVTYQAGGTGAIWDELFGHNYTDSVYQTKAPFAPEVFDLPQLDGLGNNKDLWRAMTDDPQLHDMVENFKNGITTTDLASYRSAFENILFHWFGVDYYATTDYVPYVDDRVYYAMSLMTNAIVQPNSQIRGDELQATWDGYVNTTLLKFAAQIPTSEMVNAFYLALDHLQHLQETGTDLSSLSVAQIDAEIKSYFDAGSNYAQNHPLKALGLDYDFDQDILKGDPGKILEGLVAGLPSNPAQQQSYWDNQLLLFDGLARTDLAMGASAAPVEKDNRIIGTGNNETLNGGTSNDIILGGGGNDVLNGGNGDDVLFGGTGNDTLVGGEGQNTYYWNAGFGSDVVDNSSTSLSLWDVDTLIIGKGVDPDTVLVQRNGNDVILRDPVTNSTVTIHDQLSNIGIHEVGRIMFEMGETWDGSEIQDKVIAAGITNGNDYIMGLFGSNTINGLGGDDTINGGQYYSFDTLDGGAGKDVLTGGPGNDVFKFSALTDSVSTNMMQDRITDFVVTQDKIDLTGLGFTGLDTDGGNTEPSELRLIYDAASNRTYVHSDQSTFEFYLDGNFTSTLTSNNFIFDLTTGSTTITGTSGADSLTGTAGADTILGLDGNDFLYGGGGNDNLQGGAGDDRLFGDDGNDLLQGGDGNDVLMGGNGNDTLDGGAGTDTVDYRYSSANWTINLATGVATTGSETDTLLNLSHVQGSQGNDTITGDSTINTLIGNDGNDFIYGGGGNDHLQGEAGDDRLFGDDGNDLLQGGDGYDYLTGGNGNDTLDGGAGADVADYRYSNANWTINLATGVATSGSETDTLISLSHVESSNGNDTVTGDSDINTLKGNNGNDFLYGGGGNDNLQGGSGDDRLFGDDGNDLLQGGDGYDYLTGGNGNDTLDGGAGTDVADYRYSNANWTINLATGVATSGSETDTLISLSHVESSNGNDTVTGDSDINTLKGNNGNDFLYGGGGNDNLQGGAGDDRLFGDDGNDLLQGGDGYDYLTGGNGNDTLDGGAGTDVADYRYSSANWTINLATGVATSGSETDTLISLSHVQGSNGNDNVTGDSNANTLIGNNGNDTLSGGDGDDKLYGMLGGDSMSGGVGADIFAFQTLSDSTSSGQDVITDFTKGTDKIDFSGISAIASMSDLTLSLSGGNTHIVHGTFDLLLDGDFTQGANQLAASDFVF